MPLCLDSTSALQACTANHHHHRVCRAHLLAAWDGAKPAGRLLHRHHLEAAAKHHAPPRQLVAAQCDDVSRAAPQRLAHVLAVVGGLVQPLKHQRAADLHHKRHPVQQALLCERCASPAPAAGCQQPAWWLFALQQPCYPATLQPHSRFWFGEAPPAASAPAST